ncbi:heparan-alpha-glucosaminide N-acetyltransferase domain-containing protein [Curtobacterium sp. 22159]|uniref:heparan-alpha-glucosaminide N-acetyltransferase domain-containing protein n=1 Tax=Curtobacterium sp. 22159 TaxID=3453882 RepID=UPI003F825149
MTSPRPAPHAALRGVSVPADRSQGVDVARALALVGMMATHVGGIADQVDWPDPGTWAAVAHGRSSSLFAVLAGVSIGLTSGRTSPPGPPVIGRVRGRLAVRAAVVIAIGLLLMALDTPVYVILPTYGVLFLLAIPVLRVRSGRLLVLAAACAVLSPVAALVTAPAFVGAGTWEAQLGLVYPVVTFLAYVLVGLALVRAGIGRRPVQVVSLTVGAAVASVAYVVGVVLAPVPGGVALLPGVPSPGRGSTPAEALAQVLLSPRDHSSSIVDVVGTAGVAVVVIALCMLVFDGPGRVLGRLASPLAAVGAMPLTVYAGHIVVLAFLPEFPASGAAWCWFVVGSVLFAVVWRSFLGRGPLERLTAMLTRLVPDPR